MPNSGVHFVFIYRIINDSWQVNPLWEYQISQIYYMMVQQQKKVLESIGQLSRYISQTEEQISEGFYQSYKQRDAIYDGVAKNWSETIRGVDSYYDPISKSEIEVPTVYEKAWTDGNDYIFSTVPGFDPNRSAGPNWISLGKPGSNFYMRSGISVLSNKGKSSHSTFLAPFIVLNQRIDIKSEYNFFIGFTTSKKLLTFLFELEIYKLLYSSLSDQIPSQPDVILPVLISLV